MAAVTWVGLGSPGDVTWARASSEATAVVVGTVGGHLYVRRRADTGWRWKRVGIPPTGQRVRDATLLAIEPSGALTLAVVGGDIQVWLYRPEAAAGPWSSLGGPPLDPEIVGSIAIGTTHQGTGDQHTLLLRSASQTWVRQGVGPDGTWFAIPSDPELFVRQLASVLASVAAGVEPQQHIIALVHDRDDEGALALRVAVRENSVWTWIDPGGPPLTAAVDSEDIGLSATSIRDSSGLMRACAVVGTGFEETTASMLIGSGHDWRHVALGQPGPGMFSAPVVVDKGPDPQHGDEPVTVGRLGDTLWTRSLSGDWTDRGTTPGDVTVVTPTAAFEVGAATSQRRVWTVGVSEESDLWTFEVDDAGVRWEDHGSPGSVTAVVGAYDDAIEDDLAEERPVMVFAIDEYGGLWVCLRWASAEDFTVSEGLGNQLSTWSYHGLPADAVTSAAGVGVFTVAGGNPQPSWVFVVGSDGHLWARTAEAAGWSWVDHGAPAGRLIEAGVSPIADDPADRPIVHVLADDGRLWMRSRSGPEWRWTDRGTPQGQLIFAIVGATALVTAEGRLPLAVVITEDGHLRVSVPDGASFAWTDLGTPTPGEKIVAGIGVEVVTPGTVDIAAVGSPSKQVWTVRWTPGGTPLWTARGRPADADIQTTVGTTPEPNAAGCLVTVIGNDKEIWVTTTAGSDHAWSRWDPNVPSTTALNGKTAVLLDTLPCSVVIDDRRRVHVVTPPRG
ncbi:hypothetical protein NMG29_26400 [Streptomyces cocklensis]|uniref:Uncharacterized protein n=1 Tax=Actinacidiphila cocklensis TaxID=887465 RepID=A0A9W4GSW8_9ACTN|nr:hypothetical protein [Actinacidiphila cocklensis]MDD1061705.1 hypothetical protein [Actinacidiphila cocklensis]CAG6396341.1 conserved hypothetical protein [Actinacidiphila cocklensis]